MGKRSKKILTGTQIMKIRSYFAKSEFCQIHLKFKKIYPEAIAEIRNILHRFKEIRGILRKIERSEEYLDETELFEIKNFAIDMEYLLIEYAQIKLDLDDIRPLSTRKIIKLLNPDEQITRTFTIYNAYSKKIAAIRNDKREIERQIALGSGDRNVLLKKRDEIANQEKNEENHSKTDNLHRCWQSTWRIC